MCVWLFVCLRLEALVIFPHLFLFGRRFGFKNQKFPSFCYSIQEYEKLIGGGGGSKNKKKTGGGGGPFDFLTDSTKLVTIAAVASIVGIMVGKNMSK